MKSFFVFVYLRVAVVSPQDSKEVTFELLYGGQIGERKIYSQSYKRK